VKNKVVATWFPFTTFVIIACALLPMAASAHVVSPGAKSRGFVSPQPDFADLNEGIACVVGAEIGVAPEHGSEVTGVGFLVQGNTNAYAKLLKDESEELTHQRLTGKLEEIKLRSTIPAGKMTSFKLRLCYQGRPGDVVPKVKVRLTLDQVQVYSLGHGGPQQVFVAEPPPIVPSGNTITLR
jgi:hypothetical protein